MRVGSRAETGQAISVRSHPRSRYDSDMDDSLEARRARAEARRSQWTGQFVSVAADVPPTAETVRARLEALAEISARAWALTGQPTPTWTRATMPGRVIRPGDSP